MKKILYIDTSDNEKTIVKLITEEKEVVIEENLMQKKSEVLLPLIDKLLKKCNTKLIELTALEINEGPGSYTGLRIGAAVVNTLSYLLNIKINGKKDYFFPKYQ